MTTTAGPRVRNTGALAYATVCGAVITVLYLTNWPSYAFQIRGGMPLYVYHAFAAALVVPLLFAEPASVIRVLKAPLFWWFAAYVSISFVWLLFSQNLIETALTVWRLRLLQFMLFTVMVILASHARRPVLALFILGCVFIASAFSWIDIMRPFRFVPRELAISAGRGAGMFMNPNSAGEIVVIGTLAVLPFVPMRFRALILAAMVVGVAPTLSRGGLVLCAVVLLGAALCKLLSRSQIVLVVIVAVLLVAGTSRYYDRLILASDSPVERTVTRLAVLGGGEEEEEGDGSVQARKWVAQRAQEMFLEEPLLGHGLGTTNLEVLGGAPHNMYLMFGAEQGIFGFALYVGLLIVLFRGGRRLVRTAATPQARDIGRAMVVYSAVLFMDGFFSNNVLDESHHIFMLGFIAAAALQAPRAGFGALVDVVRPRPKIKWRSPPQEQT